MIGQGSGSSETKVVAIQVLGKISELSANHATYIETISSYLDGLPQDITPDVLMELARNT
jgi:hypothetical protein